MRNYTLLRECTYCAFKIYCNKAINKTKQNIAQYKAQPC